MPVYDVEYKTENKKDEPVSKRKTREGNGCLACYQLSFMTRRRGHCIHIVIEAKINNKSRYGKQLCSTVSSRAVFCAKQYVGNTTQALRGRITGHRNNTDSALKAHAIVHRDVFDNSFSFHVICQMLPDKILEKETFWVHRLMKAESLGLNRVDPCALCTGLP